MQCFEHSTQFSSASTSSDQVSRISNKMEIRCSVVYSVSFISLRHLTFQNKKYVISAFELCAETDSEYEMTFSIRRPLPAVERDQTSNFSKEKM